MANADDMRLRSQTEAEFAQLEQKLADASPGVLEVLRVYGNYEAAVRQTDAYFASLNPVPCFSTTNSSG